MGKPPPKDNRRRYIKVKACNGITQMVYRTKAEKANQIPDPKQKGNVMWECNPTLRKKIREICYQQNRYQTLAEWRWAPLNSLWVIWMADREVVLAGLPNYPPCPPSREEVYRRWVYFRPAGIGILVLGVLRHLQRPAQATQSLPDPRIEGSTPPPGSS